MNITEKTAYVKGLIRGLELDKSKKETKVFEAIIDLLDDISLEVSDLQEGYSELSSEIEEIDEDLYALEEDFYSDDEDCEIDEEDEPFYEVTCPSCDKTLCVDEETLLNGEVKCPCGETLEFDLDSLNECDCCDCKESEKN